MISTDDDLIPLSQVPQLIRAPDPPHRKSVERWRLAGVGNPRVRLETIKVGGRRYTTAAALEVFIRATSGQLTGTHAHVGVQNRRRREDVRQADAALDADGIR